MSKKHKVYKFRSVQDMQAVPLEKIDHFCRDLALWLSVCKIADQASDETTQVKITTPRDEFGWIDDGKHDVNLNIKIRQEGPS